MLNSPERSLLLHSVSFPRHGRSIAVREPSRILGRVAGHFMLLMLLMALAVAGHAAEPTTALAEAAQPARLQLDLDAGTLSVSAAAELGGARVVDPAGPLAAEVIVERRQQDDGSPLVLEVVLQPDHD